MSNLSTSAFLGHKMFTYRVLKMEGDSEAVLLMNAECDFARYHYVRVVQCNS
jgi:hypothetical protein